ncbi:MAG: M14 family metallopeptidase [Chloroflexota bacterium]|nr:M14 family metallopeptidase [Chloroflexota bacterium]
MALIILTCAATCQSAAPVPTPTPALATAAPLVNARPTQLRGVATRPPTETPTPLEDPFAVHATPLDAPPPATLDPSLLTQVALPTAALPGDTIVIGRSVQGRALLARRIGTGERIILLAGGMHGGWEANTVALVNELIAHFASTPGDLPSDVSLVLVPVVNPDGLFYGRTPEGRFNANAVDLNRNWGCGWQDEAYWREMRVSPGQFAFSEPETAALSDYIQQIRPQVAIFYHSAAGGVYAGSCEQSIYGARGAEASNAMSAVYGAAANYRYGEEFDAYPVTGTAAGWAAGLGIAAADVELQTWTQPEFERNLAAVRAVIAWVAQAA